VVRPYSIAFTDMATGVMSRYTDNDLPAGPFRDFGEFDGNNADNAVGGSIGLNANGCTGGTGI